MEELQEWQQRYSDGESEALVRLMEWHRERLYGLAMSMLNGRRDLADDAWQTLFVSMNSRGEYDAQFPWYPYAWRAMFNACQQVRRNQGRDQRATSCDPANLTKISAPAMPADVELREQHDQLLRDLEDCLSRVSPTIRDLIRKSILDDLSLDEISESMPHVAYGTLGSRKSRGLTKLRDCLERKGYPGGNS